jgi:hypothetical protein
MVLLREPRRALHARIAETLESQFAGEHAQTYYTEEACTEALHRLMVKAQRDATHQLAWQCVPEDSARPDDSRRSDR